MAGIRPATEKSQLVRTCTWKFSGNSSSYQTKASELEKLVSDMECGGNKASNQEINFLTKGHST
jgi:hypothetical protein